MPVYDASAGRVLWNLRVSVCFEACFITLALTPRASFYVVEAGLHSSLNPYAFCFPPIRMSSLLRGRVHSVGQSNEYGSRCSNESFWSLSETLRFSFTETHGGKTNCLHPTDVFQVISHSNKALNQVNVSQFKMGYEKFDP